MMHRLIVTFLFIALVIACKPVQLPITSEQTTEKAMKPMITATPLSFDLLNQSITNEIDTLYNSKRGSCDAIEHLDYSSKNVPIVFNQLATNVDFSDLEIQEFAENIDGNYQAYVLSEYFCETKNLGCRKNIIYWQNKTNNQLFQIEWIEQELYLYRSVLWIGKNILVVREAAFPGSYSVVGIDVEKQELVYYGVVNNCK